VTPEGGEGEGVWGGGAMDIRVKGRVEREGGNERASGHSWNP
jgi:hypothetical protein